MSSTGIFTGRVWRLGDNIDTDVIAPGRYLQLSMKELGKQTLKAVRPDFADGFQPGEIILAGRNFGCGSSREHAPRVLKEIGASVIVAPSFARIFYRNCLAVGLPIALLAEDADFVADHDEITVDLDAAALTHTDSGKQAKLRAIPPEVRDLLDKGGVVPLIRAIVAERRAQQS